MYNAEGKVIGRLENGWLVKAGLDPALHQLRTPPAWATDTGHIQALTEAEGWGIRLITTDGKEWSATLAQFDKYGIAIERKHGPQIALPLQHWSVRQAQQGMLL